MIARGLCAPRPPTQQQSHFWLSAAAASPHEVAKHSFLPTRLPCPPFLLSSPHVPYILLSMIQQTPLTTLHAMLISKISNEDGNRVEL